MPRQSLSQLAREIADTWRPIETPDWEDLRDFCDQRSGGELSADELDRLTDLVEQILISEEADRA